MSTGDPKKDPVIFWLSGGVSGPGCSSFIAFSKGLGPCFFNDKDSTWTDNAHKLNEAATLVFLELPPGVGFSTQKTEIKTWDYNNTSVETKLCV